MKKIQLTNLIFLIALISVTSCNNSGKNSNNNKKDSIPDSSQIKLNQAYDKAKIIFYSLPSPIETAMIIESSGVDYNDELLNPVNKVNTYGTSKQMALNLGIYSADLSFCTLFDQPQATINYMATAKKLAESLGILDAINDSVVNLLQENMEDKNKIMSIISESFINSSSYLEENDRDEVATMVILGGWIEGLYLSVNLIGDKVENNQDLTDIIVSQSFTLDDLIGLLELYKKDNNDIQTLLTEIKQLKTAFEEVEEPITQKQFDNLVEKINKIRNGYTQ